METYGYVRVSTKNQNEARQLHAMAEQNIPEKHIFVDKQSGKDFNRPAYLRLLKKLKPSDLVIIHSIDRLGRNYDEILEQWRIITKEKQADIYVLDFPLLDTRARLGERDLTGRFVSDLVLQILAYVAQKERESIHQRQAEGIAAAKARDVHFGRKAMERPKEFENVYAQWREGKLSAREAGRKLNVSHSTFLNWSKGDGKKVHFSNQVFLEKMGTWWYYKKEEFYLRIHRQSKCTLVANEKECAGLRRLNIFRRANYMERMRRALAMLLIISMVLSMCPISAGATTTDEGKEKTSAETGAAMEGETEEPPVADGEGEEATPAPEDTTLPSEKPEEETPAPEVTVTPDAEETPVPETTATPEPEATAPGTEEPTATPEAEETPAPNNVTASGTCGENLTWVLTEDGTLTISGTGAMTNYSVSNSVTTAPWKQYINQITTVVIEEGVTGIGENAFYGCTKLTRITIPDSVTGIGRYAFHGCTSLTGVTIPDSVTSIGGWAFYNCTGLTSVTIGTGVTSIDIGVFSGCTNLTSMEVDSENPVYHGDGNCIIETTSKTLVAGCKMSVIPTDGSVTSIGNWAFYGCTGLTDITIPASVTGIGFLAFSWCTGLTSITIPASVTSIGDSAFSVCTGLTGMEVDSKNSVFHSDGNCIIETDSKTLIAGCKSSVIPTDGSVTRIGEDAFRSCTGLTTVTIPDGVTGIGSYAFYDCTGLTSITIPDSVTGIGGGAFWGCEGLTDITIPDSVTSIGEDAFYGCTGLTEIIIPDGVTSIGDYAFRYCTGLTSVTIGTGVTGIGDAAFQGCDSLTSIAIPSSVTVINDWAFNLCFNLTDVYYGGSETDWNKIDIGEENDNLKNATVHYRYAVGGTCGENLTWTLDSNGTLTISGKGEMENYDVDYFDDASYITTASWKQYINQITTVVIEEGVTGIGKCAFYGCTKLTRITIPDSVTGIGEDAFCGCTGLASVIIGTGVTSIGDYAFSGCTGLTSVTIPASVTGIGDSAFEGCTGLTGITIPDSVTSIGEDAFRGCTGLTRVTIGTGVASISECAFSGCTGLARLEVDSENPVYHSDGNCIIETDSKTLITGCKSSVIPTDGSVTGIGKYAFSGCTSLTGITIPDSVTSIGSYAFSGCTGLTSVAIPASVTSIGNGAFAHCDGLTSLEVNRANTAYHSEGNCVIETASKTLVAGCRSSVIPTNGSVTSIGEDAFYGCTGLTDITIPDGVTSIGDSAFSGCEGLTDIIIPDSVTGIGGGAFWGCEGLTSITIPVSVTSIGQSAFEYCRSLSEIHYGGSKVDWNRISIGANNEKLVGATIYYTGSSDSGNCGGAATWTLDSDGTLTISGTGTMFSYADSNAVPWAAYRNQIASVVIGDGITGIGNFAFSGCTGLTGITIPASVTGIGDSAFSGCTDLKNVYYGGKKSDWNAIAVGTDNENLTNAVVHADCVASGTCGMNLTWILDGNGTLTISGAGKMNDYDHDYGDNPVYSPWFSYRNQITAVIIEDGVTSIGDQAFYYCSGLTQVTIPDSVTTIGYSAFYECSCLKKINIPCSVTSIGAWAFYGCTGLTTAGPTGGGYTIEFGWTKTIPGDAFFGCTSLTSITIPASVTSIGGSAFSGCTGLTSMEVDSENPVYHSDGNCIIKTASKTLIAGCRSSVIPTDGSVTRIGEDAFSGCTSLTDITIPDSVTSIGRYAFDGCSKLTSITIPASVTGIGHAAFQGCDSLTSIAIPSSVTVINDWAFNLCFNLTDVYYGGSETDWNKIDIGEGNYELKNATVHYRYVVGGTCGENLTWTLDSNGTLTISGTGEMENYDNDYFDDAGYITTASWKQYINQITTVVIEEGVTGIGKCAFYGCTKLTRITIPDSVTRIGEDAFYGCEGLTGVTIPASVTGIGDSAFEGCTGLTSVTIGIGVTSIGRYAFYGCTNLTSMEVDSENPVYHSDGNCIIETDSKTLITGCRSSVIPTDGSVTRIGKDAFSGCTSLTSITIPDSVTSIGNSAFYWCTGLTSITIPASVTSIGDFAFSVCTGLTSMEVDSKNSVFHSDGNCIIETDSKTLIAGCKSSVIPTDGSVTRIGEDAFRSCTGLTSVTIGNGVTSIGDFAFYGCEGLTGITIPASVTSIGDFAFYNCSSLTDVYYGGSETDWNKIDIGEGNYELKNATVHYRYVVGGTCGENLTWTLDSNGTLTISGTGEMTDYAYIGDAGYITTAPWKQYINQITTVVIEEGVTGIGENAFYGCTSLTDITIPDSVTGIGDSAFYGCTGLTSITIPSSVISIGGAAFASGNLTTLEVAGNNQVYYSNNNCIIETATKTLVAGCNSSVIPTDGSVTSIGNDAFNNCLSLTSITIPERIISIGRTAFHGCSNLTSVTLSDGLESIGGYAFYRCNLRSITIPYTVTRIEESIFSGCNDLDRMEVDSRNTVYHSSGNCIIETASKTLIIGCNWSEIPRDGSVTSIGSGAFDNCEYMPDITIPDAITGIGSGAFSGCRRLRSIAIPNGVTSISGSMFCGCTSLSSIFIPDSVRSIEAYAFFSCIGLKNVYYGGSESDWNKLSVGGNNEELKGATIHYDCEAHDSVSDPSWTLYKDGTLVISGTRTIMNYDSYNTAPWYPNREQITAVIIENGITGIGKSAFEGCTGLTGITIPDSVTSIGDSAFEGCTSLTGITIPAGVTSIGSWAFYGCTSLTGITIPASVTSIGGSAFSGCTGLTGITIPASVTSIGDSAFYGCEGLTSITIPASVTSIGGSAFSGCTGLTSMEVDSENPVYHSDGNCIIETTSKTLVAGCKMSVIPTDGSVTSIGNWAFYGCTGLTDITIPASVTSIGRYAFSGCTGLASMEVDTGNTVYHSGGNCIIETTSKTLVAGCKMSVIPADGSVTGIGMWAFEGCSSLTGITIPDSVTSIGRYAFSGCTGLTSVTIGTGVSSIGYSAFEDCTNLTSMEVDSKNSVYHSDGNCIIETDSKTLIVGCQSSVIPTDGSVTSIGACAFSGCTSLTGDLVIPDSVTGIGDYAFYGCTGLDGTLTLPDGLISIGKSAFDMCSGFRGDLRIPDSVTTIEVWAFHNCTGFDGQLVLSNGLTDIEIGVFSGCSGLTGKLVIPDGVTYIWDDAFEGCTGFTGELVIPDSVTDFENYAFSGMTGITSVVFGKGLKRYAHFTFEGCTNITELTFHSPTVVEISGETAGEVVGPFVTLTNLKTVYVPAEAYDEYVLKYNGDKESGYPCIFSKPVEFKKIVALTINTETGIAKGLSAGMTAAEVLDAYKTSDEPVSITNAEGEEVTDGCIGTGYQLHVGEETYTLVVTGDVTGDGEVDLFDLLGMVGHMNSTQSLSGAYLEAGCIEDNGDIGLFDLYAMVNYLNGSFSE